MEENMANQYNERETERGRYGRRSEESGRTGRGNQGRDYGDRDFGERSYSGRNYGDYGERGYSSERERALFGEDAYERQQSEGQYEESRYGGGSNYGDYGNRERMNPRSYEQGSDWRSGEYNREGEQSGGTRSWSQAGRAYERGSSRPSFGERTSQSEAYSTQDWQEGYPRQSWRGEPGAFGREPGSRDYKSWNAPGPYVGRGPQGYKRSDERITEDVNECLTQNGQLDASQINVSVKDGEVTLTGTGSNRQAKRLAEDLAESCSGVTEVQNQIRVKQETQSTQQGQAGQQGHSTTTGQQTQTEQKRSAAKH
jgi:hypothetical protein